MDSRTIAVTDTGTVFDRGNLRALGASDAAIDAHIDAKATGGNANMDHHPARAKDPLTGYDPNAYQNGFADGYYGRERGHTVAGSNTSAYHSGYTDGRADRKEKSRKDNEAASALSA